MKVFSFRSFEQNVDKWREYAKASGLKVDEIGTAAMEEYIAKHPLTIIQKAFVEERKELNVGKR